MGGLVRAKRLGYWFMCRVHELGLARTLKITGREFADPMSAIQEMVESLLHLSGLDEVAGRERIERLLQPRRVQTDDIAAFYRTFRDGMRSGMQWAQLELLVALIEAYASERPIVLWVEDAHYNALSVQLVRSIVRELRERAPVCCLVTARNDGLTDESDESVTYSSFVEEEDIPVIELAPFSQQEQGQLVEELLSLDGDLAAQVVERTGGNPLFAVHLVGEWVRCGVFQVGAIGFALRIGVALMYRIKSIMYGEIVWNQCFRCQRRSLAIYWSVRLCWGRNSMNESGVWSRLIPIIPLCLMPRFSRHLFTDS